MIEAELELYNRESVPLNLKGVELRYHYTDDGLATEVRLTRTNALVGGFDVRNETANGYLAIHLAEDFTVRPGKRLKVRFEIKAVGGVFDQSNDRSFRSPENIDVLWTGDVAYSVSLASFSAASANLTASAPAAAAPVALAFDADINGAATVSTTAGQTPSASGNGFLRSTWQPASSD